MALNAGATLIPGRGTVFVGNVDATPTTQSGLATLAPGTPGSGWECIGHTSRDNNVALSKDGGDSTQIGSWWDDGLRSTTDPISYSITVNSLQVDSITLGLAFGGGTYDNTLGTFKVGTISAVPKALQVLMVDGSAKTVLYMPNVSITLGDAPEISTDSFFEIQLAGQILTSGTRNTRFEFISTTLVSA